MLLSRGRLHCEYRSALEETFPFALPCVQWFARVCAMSLTSAAGFILLLMCSQSPSASPSRMPPTCPKLHISIFYASWLYQLLPRSHPTLQNGPSIPWKPPGPLTSSSKREDSLKSTVGAHQKCQRKQWSRCATGSRREAAGRGALAAERHGGDGSCKTDGLSAAPRQGEGSPFQLVHAAAAHTQPH